MCIPSALWNSLESGERLSLLGVDTLIHHPENTTSYMSEAARDPEMRTWALQSHRSGLICKTRTMIPTLENCWQDEGSQLHEVPGVRQVPFNRYLPWALLPTPRTVVKNLS